VGSLRIVNSEPELRKIRIALPEDGWHGVEAEWSWGERVGDNIYALRNTPFYAKGLSYGDQVKVNDENGTLKLLRVVSRGGHSTYRIFAKTGQNDPQVQALFKELNGLHCGIEGANDKLIAVDVFPEADIHKVYRVLEDADKADLIDFEEGHCGHPLSKKLQ
jgi:hypothetical protein